MNQSLTLPMADKFYHDKQTSAFIRSVSHGKNQKKTIIILNTAITRRTGMHLTAGFRLYFPAMNFLLPTHSKPRTLMGKQSLLQPLVLYRINMGSQNQYVFSL